MAMLALRPPPRRIAQPKADPRFVAVSEQIKRGAERLKKHPPAAQKAREASRSARAPANERLAAAKAKVVDGVQSAPTPKPQPSSFKALLRAEIEKAMPKTLGDTEKFMEGDQSGAMKGALGANVDSQRESAAGPVDQATKKAPDPGSVPATPSAALPAEPAPARPAVDGATGMPLPATPAEASLEQSKKDADAALKDEKIKPASLAKANDARFSALAKAQGAVIAQADKAPAGFRAKEAAVLAGARAQAGGQAARGSLLLAGTRSGGNARVLSRQQQQAAKEEADRQKVAADIEGIFSRTKARVEQRLAGLDGEVSALFDPGVEAALTTMKSYVDDRIFKYKLERYLSIPGVGLARWLRDQALGLPAEVNAFYVQGRKVFQAAMDRLIDRVAALVELRLAQAKADVAAGQAQIKAYVARLPANLKATGDAAAKAVGDRFNELSAGIDAKKEELAASLAQKYKEAFDKADEALKTMQDENKGLLQQFAESLGEVVKALLEFKAKLMAILRKGQDAIQLILDDPIAFLGNLIAAVKGGFNAFVGNILNHLKAGFMKWLFGSLAAAGIALPSDLSLPSIFKLVLDVLGITYDKMRAKAVKLIGERAVGLIEKAVEYVREFVTGGPAKLWEKVKEDLANLKEMVIGAIQDWLITTVVKQAVAKVVSMFNPAGAIVQAIMAIYNVIMFVVEKAQQIMALVEAVVNSVHAIASGAIGGAISWIEKSLASAIPIVIGFLARLLGLGGISEKIKEFIKKVQAKVDAAIDKAIAKVVALVKKLFGKGGKDADPEKQKKIDAGRKAIDGVVAKYADGIADQDVYNADLAKVKQQHPVFKTLTSVKKGKNYVWRYTASPATEGGLLHGVNSWNVAKHTAAPPDKQKKKGESHHVPQKVLLRLMGEFYTSVGSELAKSTSAKTKSIGIAMRDHGNVCNAKNASGGGQLSAIWLLADDHKNPAGGAAHSPVPISSAIKEAKDISAAGMDMKNSESGKVTTDGSTSISSIAAPPGFLMVGVGAVATQGNPYVKRAHLFNPLMQSFDPKTNPGYGKTTEIGRQAQYKSQIAKSAAKSDQAAEDLKVKAGSMFKAQWNGSLAMGLAGVSQAVSKYKDTKWRPELRKLAKETWDPHMSKP